MKIFIPYTINGGGAKKQSRGKQTKQAENRNHFRIWTNEMYELLMTEREHKCKYTEMPIGKQQKHC